ncbi:MAG: DUF4843 domain-containing protein [Bacteroidales bacterium]|nr:DUF4843 domain-containing protein [Bacteroidales bacterium]
MKKNKYIIIIFSLILFWMIQGCEKEIMNYQGKPGVYFAVQHGSTAGNENTWPYQPNTNVEFFKIQEDRATVNIKVMATGSVADHDRSFTVKINADSTNATEGGHYEPLSGDFFIPAGEAYTNVPVTLIRTDDMQERDVVIGLQLLPNDNFELAFPEWDAVKGLLDGNIVDSFDASLHSIVINDVMAKPGRWVGGQNSDGSESGYWGVFSREKLELFCEYFDLTYDDFNDADKMPSVFRKQIYITISKVLIKALEEGNPILEEDGRLMWVNTCPWKSIPGVPYIPQ